MSVLYIFAGEKRRSDVRSFLEELLEQERRSLVMDEIDILRDPEGHDVLQQSVWAALMQNIENGAYNIVIAHHRATHGAEQFGPTPWDPSLAEADLTLGAFLGSKEQQNRSVSRATTLC